MKKCPQCGSTSVSKEYYLVSQTGDYECGDCGEVAWASYFEEKDGGSIEWSPQRAEQAAGRLRRK